MSELKLPFGIREGLLVTIHEVDSGLRCGCRCPTCDAPLLARKGNINVHHFAHYNTPECVGGVETVVHNVCKDIISKASSIVLPSYVRDLIEIYPSKEIEST